MSSRPPAAIGDPVQPVDLDHTVEDGERASWDVLRTGPKWDVWRDHNRRGPLPRTAKRGSIAAATAGAIVGVLSLGGLLAYPAQWQVIQNRAAEQLSVGGNPYELGGVRSDQDPVAAVKSIVDFAAQQPPTSEGLVGVVDGQLVAATPNAAAVSGDAGFVRMVAQLSEPSNLSWASSSSYSSLSSAAVYEVSRYEFPDGTTAALVRVVDLTSERGRLNLGFLTYGLVGLGIAGVAGGTVYVVLGRGRNRKVEPDGPGDPT